jgi:hypothetical protein
LKRDTGVGLCPLCQQILDAGPAVGHIQERPILGRLKAPHDLVY